MKYLASALSAPIVGQSNFGKKIVVPNQSMSLQEILERFTRGEPLNIGRDVQYHESDDDLEKLQTKDLVDKAEYVEKMKQTQKDFEKQERRRQKAAADKLISDAAKKLADEAEKNAK